MAAVDTDNLSLLKVSLLWRAVAVALVAGMAGIMVIAPGCSMQAARAAQ